MAKVIVNGEPQEVQLPLSLTELIRQNDVQQPEMVSVQLNDDFVDRNEWDALQIKEGDSVDFLYFMGGGSLWLTSQKNRYSATHGTSCCRMSASRDRRRSWAPACSWWVQADWVLPCRSTSLRQASGPSVSSMPTWSTWVTCSARSFTSPKTWACRRCRVRRRRSRPSTPTWRWTPTTSSSTRRTPSTLSGSTTSSSTARTTSPWSSSSTMRAWWRASRSRTAASCASTARRLPICPARPATAACSRSHLPLALCPPVRRQAS